MKNLLFLMGYVLISNISLGDGHQGAATTGVGGTSGRIAEPRLSYSSLDKKNRKVLAKIIVCARDLIEQKRGDAEYVAGIAADFLEKARRDAHNLGGLLALERACKRGEWIKYKVPSREDQYKAAQELSSTDFSLDTRSLIAAFSRPTIKCYKAGAAVNLLINFKVDINLFCIGTNGRQWSGFSLGGGAAGIVVSGTINGGKMEKERAYHKTPVDFSTSQSHAGGFVLAEYEEAPGRVYPGSTPIKGGGVGMGNGTFVNGNMNVKLIPLGTDEQSLIRSLFGEDRR